VAAWIEEAAGEGDPLAVLHRQLDGWRLILADSDFRAGCPVVAVAVEAREEPAVAEAVADAFARWEQILAGALRSSGVSRARAARLATHSIAAIEGAVILCRARRDTKPLDDVGRELEAAIVAAQGGSGR
jgi:hypothetical protein